ncbi:MAG: rhomboid family intramembrane serine protease [Armatimonadetes bacterium]|nr:rhomboid family intramembrane serine protease [Armatimonadota bacterium]
MRSTNTTDTIRYWLFQDRIPLTKLVIVSNVGTFLAIALFRVYAIARVLGFAFGPAQDGSPAVIPMPWALFTYPLVGVCCGVLSLIFSIYWLWVAGGSLERSWGTTRFGYYFFAMCAISAAGLALGSLITRLPVSAIGLWLPIAGVTVAFAMLNPEEQILFMFVIPLKLKYLALIDVVIVLVKYGQMSPLLGVFALAGCAFSYWYVIRPNRYRAPVRETRGKVARAHRKPSLLRRLNPFSWIREYRDRKRLERLFRDSERTDDDAR